MKIHEYNEMMAYLLRPTMARGGRIGFAKGDIVTTPELKKLLKKYEVVLSDSNFSRSVKELGIKPNKIERKNTTWIEPSEEEFKNIAKENKIRREKNVRYTKEGIEAFEERKNKVADIIEEAKGNITVKRIRDQLEGTLLSKNEIKKIAEDLGYTLPSGRAKGNIDIQNINMKTKKLIEDINILKNDKKLNDIIKKPDFDVTEDVLKLKERATEILPKSDVSPVRRVAQLLMAYSGDDPEFAKYVGEVSDDLKMAADSISPGLRKGQFGGLQGTLDRIAAEKEGSIAIGKDSGFFASQRKRLGKLIRNILGKRGTVSIDEIKAIAGSRAKTPIYNIFVQGIKQTINEDKMRKLDRFTANAEIDLQKAKTKEEKIRIKDKYNAKVQKFVDKANKNLKPGELPIRAFKISLDVPKNTIKNKAAYNKYKSYFDNIHTKYGYSFEVQEDIMTSEQARKYLNTDAGKKTLKDRYTKFGGKADRLLSIAVGLGGIGLAGVGSGLFKPTSVQASEVAPGTEQLRSAGESFKKTDEEGFTTTEKLLVGTTAAASPLLTKTGRKIYGGIGKGGLKAFGSVPSALGFSASQFVDINPFSNEFGELQEDPNLAIAGADLLLPELGKKFPTSGTGRLAQLGRFALNPFQLAEKASKFGKIGRGIASLARVPSLMTPVGLTLMGASVGKEYYDFARDEIERVRAMSPEERQAYNEMLTDEGGMVDISREGFDEGGPSDPSKRKFMKIMGGLASLPVVGKFFRVAEQTPVVQNIFTEIKKLKNSETLMPDWFPTFLDKFRREGVAENIFKKKKVEVSKAEYDKAFAEGKGQDYYTDVARTQEYKANNPDHMDYYKYEDTDQLIGTTYTNEKVPGVKVDDFDGEVSVNWENDYSQPVSIEYVKPGMQGPDLGRLDKYEAGFADKKINPEGEFAAVDQEVYATDPDGGYDTNAIIVNSLDDMMEGTTRVMEEYATGKPVRTLSKGEGKVIEAEVKAEQAAESAAEMADDFGDFE
jgi:hypothetical protein